LIPPYRVPFPRNSLSISPLPRIPTQQHLQQCCGLAPPSCSLNIYIFTYLYKHTYIFMYKHSLDLSHSPAYRLNNISGSVADWLRQHAMSIVCFVKRFFSHDKGRYVYFFVSYYCFSMFFLGYTFVCMVKDDTDSTISPAVLRTSSAKLFSSHPSGSQKAMSYACVCVCVFIQRTYSTHFIN
jgi:hypothetical protein